MNSNNALSQADLESIERVVFKQNDDIAVSIARSFERLEERMDAMEARLHSRISELEDRAAANRQSIEDSLGDVREDIRARDTDEG